MYCTNCGRKLRDTARFCPYYGIEQKEENVFSSFDEPQPAQLLAGSVTNNPEQEVQGQPMQGQATALDVPLAQEQMEEETTGWDAPLMHNSSQEDAQSARCAADGEEAVSWGETSAEASLIERQTETDAPVAGDTQGSKPTHFMKLARSWFAICGVFVATTAILLFIANDGFLHVGKVNKLLQMGAQYVSDGNYEAAVLAFEEAVSLAPKSPKPYQALIDLYLQQGATSDAVDVIGRGLQNVRTTAVLERWRAQLDEVCYQWAVQPALEFDSVQTLENIPNIAWDGMDYAIAEKDGRYALIDGQGQLCTGFDFSWVFPVRTFPVVIVWFPPEINVEKWVEAYEIDEDEVYEDSCLLTLGPGRISVGYPDGDIDDGVIFWSDEENRLEWLDEGPTLDANMRRFEAGQPLLCLTEEACFKQDDFDAMEWVLVKNNTVLARFAGNQIPLEPWWTVTSCFWLSGEDPFPVLEEKNGETVLHYYTQDGTLLNGVDYTPVSRQAPAQVTESISDPFLDDPYWEASLFTEGYAAVCLDGKWGYIDTKGDEVIPCQFDNAQAVFEGKAWVQKNGKWGVLDVGATKDLLHRAKAGAVISKKDADALYLRYLLGYFVPQSGTASSGEQRVLSAVGSGSARAYWLPLSEADRQRCASLVAGYEFWYAISPEDLAQVLQQLYGASAPTLTPESWNAQNSRAFTPLKNPQFSTFDGLGLCLVYDAQTGEYLVGTVPAYAECFRADYVKRSGEETESGASYLRCNSFYVCRGEYQEGGFVVCPDGSVFAIVDKYGEVPIDEADYNRLLEAYQNAQADFAKFQNLIEEIIEKYKLQCSDMQMNLGMQTQGTDSAAGGESQTVIAGVSTDSAVDRVQDYSQEDKRAATQVFVSYYCSYLNAINALDGSLTEYCTDTQRARQAERIFRYNADFTFENLHMLLDEDSFTMGYENGMLTAHYNVRCENDCWRRDTGEKRNPNIALQVVTAQKDEASGVWYVASSLLENETPFGQTLTELTTDGG